MMTNVDQPEAAPNGGPDFTGAQTMNEKIMVVDDEPGMLALLEIVLRRKGYTVLTAGGAYQALDLLAKEKPDLFILDIIMPGITGLELCRQLRNRPDTAQIPVLMLSGWPDAEAAQRGFAAGADDYLPKATSHVQIVKRVQALLSRSNGRQRLCTVL
jgi:DNA-binding response OmpR family regulator